MSESANPRFFFADVSMPQHLQCYVTRQADVDLLDSLRQREFTVILSSRKVGKSSLMERCFATLRSEGVLIAIQELSVVKEGRIEEEAWYLSLVNALVNDANRENGITIDGGWKSWWQESMSFPPGARLTEFLRKYFLEATRADQHWIVAIDEIDATIPLPFSDDFFAAIRRMKNLRASDPIFERLTFLLVGVNTTPARLIKDKRRTPFNLGRGIVLKDFTAEQAALLLRGLGEPEEASHPALTQILDWTGGHPYFTQLVFKKLAERVSKAEKVTSQKDWIRLVDETVRTELIDSVETATPDCQLDDIAVRQIGSLSDPRDPNYNPSLKRQILSSYRRALIGKLVKDDALAAPLVELKLCGLLVPDPADPSRLVVRNRLYRTVFDAAWVRAEMPRNQWQRVAVAAVLLAVLTTGGISLWSRQAKIADLVAQIERAETDVPTAALTELRGYYGQEERAQELLAGYWMHRARITSVQRPSDEAAIVWLKALSIHALPEAQLQARRALSGSLRHVLATFRHAEPVRRAKFSPDGRRVVTASYNTAQVWDAESGDPLGSPLKHKGSINHAEFDAGGRRVVTASDDNIAQVWNTETGQPIGSPLMQKGRILHVAFKVDGQPVVAASWGDIARVWDVATAQPIGIPMTPGGAINDAKFSADGRRLVTASDDNTAQVWDAESGQPLGSPLKHKGSINHAEFDADGRRVVTASDDNNAQVWNAETGQALGRPLTHDDSVIHAEFSADGRSVVTASNDTTARIWDAESGQTRGRPLKHNSWVSHAAFSLDGRRVVTASEDRTARVWDSETGQPVGSPLRHQGAVVRAAFSADGRRLVTASDDNTARVWDTETRQPLGNPLKHEASVLNAAFSADGRRIVTASWDMTARVWNAETRQPLGDPLQHELLIFHAEISADGRRVVAVCTGNTARVWDAETSQPLGSPLKHENIVNHAEFSADGRLVVTTSDDHTARIWNAKTGQPFGSPLIHENTVIHAAFSTDGRRVVTASFDNTARVWDAVTGELIGNPLKHYGVIHAEFSADGRRVITVGGDETARVWEAETGQPLGSPLIHEGLVVHAAFSADGRCIVTATSNALTWHFEQSPSVWQPQGTVWANGAHWMSSPLFKNPTGEEIRIADSWTGDILLIRDLSLHEPEEGLPELTGTADELLTKYLKRFSLKFEDDQKSPILRPAYPVGSPQNNTTIRSGPVGKLPDSRPESEVP